MKRKLYIIPGFGETTKSKPYREIRKTAQAKGYTVISVNPKWDYKTMSDWIDAARSKILKHGTENAVVLGFSFGAYIAIILSHDFFLKKLIICSPSPYFSEDLKHIPKISKKFFGKRRIDDFKKYKFYAGNAHAVFMVGTKEWPFAQKRINERYLQWKGKKEKKILKGVTHDIHDSRYIHAIKKEL